MYKKILVPVDGSDTSHKGLMEAVQLAKLADAQLKLIHIVNEFLLDYTYSPSVYSDDLIAAIRVEGQNVLESSLKYIAAQGLSAETRLLESIGGAAADLILKEAEDWSADLIVMGTHGRRGLRRLALGSDAEDVVRMSRVPVLLVHSDLKHATQRQRDQAALAQLSTR